MTKPIAWIESESSFYTNYARMRADLPASQSTYNEDTKLAICESLLCQWAPLEQLKIPSFTPSRLRNFQSPVAVVRGMRANLYRFQD